MQNYVHLSRTKLIEIPAVSSVCSTLPQQANKISIARGINNCLEGTNIDNFVLSHCMNYTPAWAN